MICLQNPDYERIFRMLSSSFSQKHKVLPGDEWMYIEKQDANNSNDVTCLKNGYVPLLSPLENAIQIYYRKGEFYYSAIQITAKRQNTFNDFSSAYARNLKEQRLMFMQTSRDLTGFIVRGEADVEVPLASILSLNRDLTRGIVIGSHGSRNLRFRDETDFRIELGRLNDYTNLLLHTIYQYSVYAQVNEKLPILSLPFPVI